MSIPQYSRIKNRYALPILFLLIVAIILFFGLRPKTFSSNNDILWLADKKALSFHNNGIAYVEGIHLSHHNTRSTDFTLQIIVTPKRSSNQGFKAILTMYSGDAHHQLGVWQWGNTVIAMNGDDYNYSKRWPRISATDALTPGVSNFITITSGNQGTRMFNNDRLVAANKKLRLAVPDDGDLTLTLGNSVFGKHGWEGETYGVAFHDEDYSSLRVMHDYFEWLQYGYFSSAGKDDLQLMYLFNGKESNLVADLSRHNQPLQLPSKLKVLKKLFFCSPLYNLQLNKAFFIDVLLNLCGFVPLGAVTYYLLKRLQLVSKNYKVLVVVIFCFFLSFCIEVWQAWLPGRTSSFSDLILNTTGGLLGVLLTTIRCRLNKNIPLL